MKNLTNPGRAARMDADKGRFQIIYRTFNNLDYCRETAPLDVATYAEAAKWAVDYVASTGNKHVAAFLIERW